MADGSLPQNKDPLSSTARVWQRWGMLKGERQAHDAHAKELSKFILPRSSRFHATDRARAGKDRYNSIYDNTPTRALYTLGAGMMAGMTSPARPWFRLAVGDADLMKAESVKLWLAQVTQLMLQVFARSNTYNALHSCYMELGTFGTSASIVAPDFDNIVHHFPLTFGEYAISTNWKGQVDTIYREFQKPVHAVVREFGYENCSTQVQSLWNSRSYDSWVTIVHGIEPRLNHDPSKRGAKDMPFRSVYFEQEAQNKTKVLRESGFEDFCAIAPRWQVFGQDVYGVSPGMDALGDIKQLQHEQLRKANAIDYQTKPPVILPTAAKGQEASLYMPGGVSYADFASGGGQGVTQAFKVDLRLDFLLEDIRDVRERIRGAFYADLFLMLANGDNGRMTATEVAERHEEKLLMLGPVLERLHNEMLSPLIDMTFARLVETDVLPPPPPEMEGMALNVEFVSMLAQAQRAVATNAIDRYVMTLGTIAGMGRADILDKLDVDDLADSYGDVLGVDPQLINSNKDVALIRQSRQQAQAQAAQAEQMAAAADGISKLKGVTTNSGGDAAANAIDLFSGYS